MANANRSAKILALPTFWGNRELDGALVEVSTGS